MITTKSTNGWRNIFSPKVLFSWSKVVVLYNIVCILITLAIVAWWLHQFSLENLSCSIDIKSYLKYDQDVQPMFSVCTTDPLLDKKLKNLTAHRFNKSGYIKFLRGDEYHEKLRNIDYNDIKFDWADYFSSPPNATLLSERGKFLGRVQRSEYWTYYTSYIGLQSNNKFLTTCIGLQPLRKEVSAIRIGLYMNVFEQGIRPSTSRSFRVFLHYPHQIIRSYSTKKSLWDPIGNKSSYYMSFAIQDVQVLQRYSTRENECLDEWRNYDKVTFKTLLGGLGCQSPYQKFSGMNYSVCSNKEKMKKTLLYPSNRLMRAFENPCRSLETAEYKYSEHLTNELENNTIRMTFNFASNFREIVQYPKINKGVRS